MGPTILKHDAHGDSDQKILISEGTSCDATPDQAFYLAGYILTGTLAEEVKDANKETMTINMEGSLKGFVEDCEKHKEIHSEDVTPKSIYKSLMEHKGEYSTISPVEIVKAIGKEVVIKNTWGAIGLKAVAHVEKRDAMVKAYLATLDEDDKA